MKPDAYFKFYPGDWLGGTQGFDAECHGAYLLICLYHRGKESIPKDHALLRDIAHVRPEGWNRVWGRIGEKFKDCGDRLVHERIVADWKEDCEQYQAATERAANARANVSPKDSSNVRPIVKPQSVISNQESLAHTQCAERPSLQEVIAYADMIGLAKWKAEDFFNEMEAGGWLDYQHRPIQNWQAALNRVRTKWEADGRPSTPPVAKSNQNAPTANVARLAGIPTRAEVVEYAKEKWTDGEWQNWANSFYAYWSDQKREWKRRGTVIDWKIELSANVARWKA